MTKNLFILIDGSSYFYRAFHALPPLHNSKGQPTGAVYGVINMIRRLIKDYPSEYMGVVFDSKGKTFRDELYPDYKATRPAMPDELSQQFEPLLKMIEAMGLPIIRLGGIEADDIIGTLAHQAAEEGFSVLISTGDKDMAQLVNDKITLINTMSNTVLDPVGVEKKFGVAPAQIVDYLALMGDKVDNIPGVPSVGPKTAVKWLQTYGSLQNIIENAEEIKGKVGEKLRESLTMLPLAQQLVTIKKDVELDMQVHDLKKKPADNDTLINVVKGLEFRLWLEELLNSSAAITQLVVEKNYHTILTKTEFETWLAKLNAADQLALHIEATTLDAISAEFVGMSFAITPHEAIYLPVGHTYENAPTQLDKSYVLTKLTPLLENPNIKKIGQNLKYVINIFRNEGIKLQGTNYDTMLESYILNSTSNRHDINTLALKYLGQQTIHFEDIAGKASKQITFNQITIEIASQYAAEAADVILQLHQKLWPEIKTDPKLSSVFNDIEMPLVNVLANIERQGVLINADLLRERSLILGKRILELEEQAYQLAGEVFNLGSPKQLQEIFYEKLKLPILAKTPTGQPSTAESVLQDLAYDFPLPKVIIEYRQLSKLKSTYLDALPQCINKKTCRVHTSYNQAVTATGRLSSTEPNLQNIPIRTEEGRMIRQAFIAPPGYLILAADYSQIELRLMAHLSQDENLLRAFAQNLDIHQATSAEIFHVPLEEVTAEQRRRAKAINFGLIYGMSAFGLAKQLDLPRDAAQLYIDRYFERYPGVKAYMDNSRKYAKEMGYVETLYGRRLYIPEINARNLQRQRAAERAAINAPLQGTAADLIKKAMITIDAWLTKKYPTEAYMIMQVHDELVFEIKEDKIEEIAPHIRQLMTENQELSVSLAIGLGIGKNWDEAH